MRRVNKTFGSLFVQRQLESTFPLWIVILKLSLEDDWSKGKSTGWRIGQGWDWRILFSVLIRSSIPRPQFPHSKTKDYWSRVATKSTSNKVKTHD